MKYLGIKIIPSLDTVTVQILNVDPLIKETEKQLNSWQSLGISWFSRVTAVKMKILPKCIFILDTSNSTKILAKDSDVTLFLYMGQEAQN